jgi:prolyl-tRNA synthetase
LYYRRWVNCKEWGFDGILLLVRYSTLFAKSFKSVPKDEVAINAKYLIQGGFIDKLMSGSYTILPLGKRVLRKIEQIIREEMDATGAQEMLMPLLHPKEIWNETGRWDSAREVMYQFEKDEKEYALSFTHEEIALDVVRKHVSSYKDFPVKIYHFSTKFRNELRAKSGILRGREFIMKDLYSLHVTEGDMNEYYDAVKDAYLRIFKRAGFDAKVVEAAGGVFTENRTHEFQVFCETGEDTIYYCERCDFAQNKEIVEVKDGDKCPKCGRGKVEATKAVEVGNIFRFGKIYSKKMNVVYSGKDGQREYPYLGSYGIGLTRLMGVAVELFHDDRGIIWPEAIAPYRVYLTGIMNHDVPGIMNRAEEVYKKLSGAGVEVLFDDRDLSAGEKFATCDLIGIPIRLVVSAKTGGQIEFKERGSRETKLLSFEEICLHI